jgi:hypothetical protein
MPGTIELPTVERKPGSEGSHLLPHSGDGAFVRDVVEHLRDQRADLAPNAAGTVTFTETAP